MQCTAIKPHSKYRRMMEIHAENSITSVLYGAGSTLVNIFQWTAVSRWKQSCNSFSRPFSEHYKKMATGTGYVNWFLARLSRPWLRKNLIFFSTRLHKILYEFSLELDSHKSLLVLWCSIALLTRQSKSTVTVQSNFSGRDAGGAGGARPRQLTCQTTSSCYSHAIFFHSMLACPCIAPYIKPLPQ